MTPKRRAVAGGFAAAVLGSGVTAALLLGPGSTSASTTPTTEPAAESEADEGAAEPEVNLSIGLDADELLDALVDNGVITQEQADAVADQLQESVPEGFPDIRIRPAIPNEIFSIPMVPPFPDDFDVLHPGRMIGRPFGLELETVAEAIGIDERELRQRLWEGESIAEIAEASGTDPQTVIDALVTEYTERVTDWVEGDDDADQPASTDTTTPESTETTTAA